VMIYIEKNLYVQCTLIKKRDKLSLKIWEGSGEKNHTSEAGTSFLPYRQNNSLLILNLTFISFGFSHCVYCTRVGFAHPRIPWDRARTRRRWRYVGYSPRWRSRGYSGTDPCSSVPKDQLKLYPKSFQKMLNYL
jgi:hypothetical protein